ncbi:uncharacterized protein LOC131858995 [Cryptomeria japonica]|uniref:uncharacterized protein LOC131858995 n=1 Tax=Cryptomeria japonica TaxID=3369 RepID=UPI0027DA3299|nr:uncharacterized protein LOC131858995 [Cryptomeria japonica]
MEQPFRIFNNPLSDVLDNNYEKRDKWKNIPYNENKGQYNNRQCNHHNGERRTSNGGIIGNWNNRDKTNNVSNNRGKNGNNGNYGNNGNGNNGNGNNNNQNGGGGNNGNNNPFWGRDKDSSEDEKSSDVQWRRESQQYNVQQVFTDDDVDTLALRRLFHEKEPVHSLRNLTYEENKAYTMAIIAQAKSNYQLRNITVNPEQGKPSGIFSKVPKASGNKDTITNEEKEGAVEKVKQIEPPKLTKLIERKQISKPLSNCGSFMS